MRKAIEVDNAIVAMLNDTPGLTRDEVTDNLKAMGIKTGAHGVALRLTRLRKEVGLQVTKAGRDEWLWYPPKYKPSNTINLARVIVEIMQEHGEPTTAAAIVARIAQKHNTHTTSRHVAMRLNSLAKRGKVVKLECTKRHSNRHLWGIAEQPSRASKPPEQRPHDYVRNTSEADENLNRRTLELVPQEHLPAIYEAAERMKAHRGKLTNSGQPKVGKTSGCDWPIRALFEHARDDMRETRYSALALWLSWMLDDQTEAA